MIACAIAGTWIGAPQRASACSCAGRSTLVAPAGDTHPQNAAVYFAEDCGGNREAWSVTVDGVAATLSTGGAWASINGVAIEPAPAMGAEVVLSVECNAVFDEPACDGTVETVERARFTITGPDTTPPPAIDAIALEQEDGEFYLGCDDTRLDLRLGAVVELGEIEPGTWAEITFSADGESIAQDSRTIPTNGVIESSHHVARTELAGQEVCVGVAVRDAAGNATELEEDCTEIAGEGCGCSTAPGRGAIGTLVGLLALVGLRRARPSRRRASSSRVDAESMVRA